jgi:serine/threonine protein kinase
VKHGNRFLRFYGITQDPISKRFRIVTQFTDGGSLKEYLDKNFITLTWQQKIDILYYIVHDIANIHRAGILHRIIHPRNILMHGDLAFLSDFRVSDYENRSSIMRIRVKKYVSPEFIKGELHNKFSDIYHLGLIMYYLAIGIEPYSDDFKNPAGLFVCISRGYIPEFPNHIPESSIPASYNKIMKACLNVDPTKRPDIKKLQKIFNSWRQNPPYNIVKQFELCDNQIKNFVQP